MSRLFQSLQSYQATVEEGLSRALSEMGEAGRLRDACEFALLNGGKRLRPGIVLMVAEALGAPHPVWRVALATEFFHTASLIADDLPCMDDARERRDRPALHLAFGEDVALLASYALIAEGYQYIADNVFELEREFPGRDWAHIGMLALRSASTNTGIRGTTGGQFLDLHPPESVAQSLPAMLHMKTTTLFEISFVFGWLFGGGDAGRLASVVQLARHFGLAYQIADDLEDVEQDSTREQAANYAIEFGIDEARAALWRALDAYASLADELELSSGALLEITALLRGAGASA